MGVTKRDDATRRLQCDFHLENIGNLFKNLYYSDNLTDVTIACKDGVVNAHKIVLSAYSTYFNDLLTKVKQINTTHITFVMHKISIVNMKLLMEFMYKGYIDIPEQTVPELLAIAAELDIKGLQFNSVEQNRNNLQSNKTVTSANEDDGRRFNTRFKGRKRVPVTEQHSEAATLRPANRKIFIKNPEDTTNFVIKDISGSNGQLIMEAKGGIRYLGSAGSSFSQDDVEIENGDVPIYITPESPSSQFTPINVENIKVENEEKKPYQCDKCTASFSRSNDLTNHISSSHRNTLPYQCSICDRKCATAAKLKSHMRNYHDEEDYKPSPHEKRSMSVINPESFGSRSGRHSRSYDENPNNSSVTQSIIKQVREVNYDETDTDLNPVVKRKRGRPRTRELIVKPKQGRRGRPKKIKTDDVPFYQENYDLASLPYGDFSYLTSELASHYNSEQQPIFPEPVLGTGSDLPQVPDVLSITKISEKAHVQESPTDLTISCVPDVSTVQAQQSTKIGNTTITPITTASRKASTDNSLEEENNEKIT